MQGLLVPLVPGDGGGGGGPQAHNVQPLADEDFPVLEFIHDITGTPKAESECLLLLFLVLMLTHCFDVDTLF